MSRRSNSCEGQRGRKRMDKNKLKKVNKNHHTIANKTLTRKSIIIFCVRLNPFRRQSYFSASPYFFFTFIVVAVVDGYSKCCVCARCCHCWCSFVVAFVATVNATMPLLLLYYTFAISSGCWQ